MISPIINGLAWVTFFLFYMLYKYLFLWVYDPTTVDSGGLFFPKAIQHVFVGLYIQQVCLAALFFLARNGAGKPTAIPEGALMIVLIVLTVRAAFIILLREYTDRSSDFFFFRQAFFHAILNNSYGPLVHALPLSLVEKTYEEPVPAGSESGLVSSLETPPIVAGPSDVSDGGVSTEAVEGGRDGIASTVRRVHGEKEGKGKDGEGFLHPAVARLPRTVWLPNDAHGLAQAEEKACREVGICASSDNATMDEKGKVHVSGRPPDAQQN